MTVVVGLNALHRFTSIFDKVSKTMVIFEGERNKVILDDQHIIWTRAGVEESASSAYGASISHLIPIAAELLIPVHQLADS